MSEGFSHMGNLHVHHGHPEQWDEFLLAVKAGFTKSKIRSGRGIPHAPASGCRSASTSGRYSWKSPSNPAPVRCDTTPRNCTDLALCGRTNLITAISRRVRCR
jgi:hypothetical protein